MPATSEFDGKREPVGVRGGTRPGPAVRFRRRFCYLLFLASGFAALIYEISWSRQIGLLFGHTAQAAAVVLWAWFTGLAIGYAAGAQLPTRVHPLKAYAIAEAVAAVWAVLVPTLLATIEASGGLAWLAGNSELPPSVFRGLFCLLLLLPATAALGATLPLMAEFLSRSSSHPSGSIATAYGMNTLGACLGVGATTLFLLITVGIRGSSYLAAGLSGLCAAAAWLFASRVGGTASRDSQSHSQPLAGIQHTSLVSLHWTLFAALAGFGTLALEVLYTRLFSLVFHNSTYTFGAVVAAFLLALAAGSFLAAPLLRRFRSETVLAACSWTGAIAVFLSLLIFLRVTRLEYFEIGQSFAGYFVGAFGLVLMVVVPPVTLLGILLPAVWRGVVRGQRMAGRPVGHVTMINTLAAAIGAVAASFVLLPTLGLWASFGLIIFVFSLIAGGVLLRARRSGTALLLGLTSLFTIFLLGTEPGPDAWFTNGRDEHVIRRWHSAYGWIDVVQMRPDNTLKVRQNLHYRFGATGTKAAREYRQAHLPLLLHPRPRDVAFLGLGTGLTAAGALPHPEVERITIVELIPEVVSAARMLGEHNFGLVDRPNVEIQIDDARHALLSSEKRFDVVVSDLFVPWESETGYLYTVEHYHLARKRLRSGGLFCQWLPLYQLGAADFELIADSFATVFPHTTLWWGQLQSRRPILALIGSELPLQLDAPTIDARLTRLKHSSLARDDEIQTAEHLVERLGGRWLPRNPERLNTDEFPRVEFLTPLSHQNRRLLQGRELELYFDSIFTPLPESDIRLTPESPVDAARRRAVQRLILFGDNAPFRI